MLENTDYFMGLALEEAWKSFKLGEVPVGAIIIDNDGKQLSTGHNIKELSHDTTDHAEICAMRLAGKALGNWRLNGCTLITTLEPCFMCLGAALNFRVDKIIFGAYDNKAGPLSLGHYFIFDERLNHKIQFIGGVRHWECSNLLSKFFKERRGFY